MSQPSSVLQVIILREGLLVGTEVFVAGRYSVGSAPEADLQLEDRSVAPLHAYLHFRDGGVGLEEATPSTAVFVNGHRVSVGTLRARDDVSVGPYSLKVRVLGRPRAVAGPSSAAVAVDRPLTASPPRAPREAARVEATAVSARRSSAGSPEVSPGGPFAAPPGDRPRLGADVGALALPPAARFATPAPQRLAAADDETLAAPPKATGLHARPRLFVERSWGATLQDARSFAGLDPKAGLVAREDDRAPLPLWGFGLDGQEFHFAEERGGVYRVYVPSGSSVERRATDQRFYRVETSSLELGRGRRPCVTLGRGHAVRFVGRDGMRLLAYVASAQPRPVVSPLAGLPKLAVANLVLLSSALAGFLSHFAQPVEVPDFEVKTLHPIRPLLPPPRPRTVEARPKAEPLSEVVPKEPRPRQRSAPGPRDSRSKPPVVPRVAAGPGVRDILAAIDKLGSGPGARGARTDFRLKDLIGKEPIASAGPGLVGLGDGGGGGAIKGLELLSGKGGRGIGVLGAGGTGKGDVRGRLWKPAHPRQWQAHGSIDREAVAKVINAHLGEISSCYERELIKDSSLAGKIVLEWTLSTRGTVTAARSRSSTLHSHAVEACILSALKKWKFPPARGAEVVVTYPFMFDSTGF